MSVRILVIADAVLPVPPLRYGGAERVLAALCDGFVERGHEVVLMASPGSTASGTLVTHQACDNSSFRSRAFRKAWFQPLSLAAVRGCDVVLNAGRVDYLHALLLTKNPLAVRFDNPIVQKDVDFLLRRRQGADLRFIAVSDSQRSAVQGGGWEIVPNAVDTDLYRPKQSHGDDLAFLGRVVPQKGIETAIRVARRTGRRLRVGGIAPDPEFFDRAVRPHLGDGVDFLGELDGAESRDLLASSSALLFPISGQEAFGLVMAEALSCGTPVIAMRAGPTPEIVRDGVTGFLCAHEDGMIDAVSRLDEISRDECRADALRRFSLDRMTTDHLRVLDELAGLVRRRDWRRPL
jgi:glycosyltransferase involved in cell wall biosynthesis